MKLLHEFHAADEPGEGSGLGRHSDLDELSDQGAAHGVGVHVVWSALMLRDNPVAFTWRALRDAVTAARAKVRDSRTDGLHRALPDWPADAALLHERLGMEPKAAAALMGLGEPELHVQLKAAHRMLAGLDNSRDGVA
ncbi:hypothetical protein ACIQOV_34945 [Kitasatospora sp. NPDC091257]|uniref:hypothetical protein n=1 Tax=Kitasatospora sp. NPDC091257 TaxID=3364084 RepID=UPI0037FC756C